MKKQIEHLPFGRIAIQRGHTVFEIETQNGEIREAQYNVQSALYDLSKGVSQSIAGNLIVKKGCVYIPALNKNNALKKYQKHPQQSHYFIKEATMDLSEMQWTSIHKNKSRKP